MGKKSREENNIYIFERKTIKMKKKKLAKVMDCETCGAGQLTDLRHLRCGIGSMNHE